MWFRAASSPRLSRSHSSECKQHHLRDILSYSRPGLPSCRRWRDIAIGTSAFWANIDLRLRSELLDLFEERSRETTLKLSFWIWSPNPHFAYHSVQGLLRRNAYRISHLYLDIENSEGLGNVPGLWVDSFIDLFLGLDLPVLSHFTFGLEPHDIPIHLTSRIGFDAPELTHLALHSKVPLEADFLTKFSHLQSLALHVESLIQPPTLTTIRSALSQCSSLTTLRLKVDHDFDGLSPSPTPIQPRVLLPSLSVLEIEGFPCSDVASIMDQISIPVGAEISFVVVHAAGQNVFSAVDIIAVWRACLRPFEHAQIEESGDSEPTALRFRSQHAGRATMTLHFDQRWPFDLTPVFEALDSSMGEYLLSLNLSELVSHSLPGHRTLVRAFSRCPRLQLVTMVMCHDLDPIFDAFLAPTFSCPNLTSLDLRESIFTPRLLEMFLMKCRQSGRPIERLRIDKHRSLARHYQFSDYVTQSIEVGFDFVPDDDPDDVFDSIGWTSATIKRIQYERYVRSRLTGSIQEIM